MFLMVHVFLTVQQESTVCPTCVSDGVGVYLFLFFCSRAGSQAMSYLYF